MQDARFEDVNDAPLRLVCYSEEDISVASTLLQDAVLSSADMSYDKKRRQFVLLLNRFRWEDKVKAEQERRPYERVRSLVVIEDVLAVGALGIEQGNQSQILSLMSLRVAPDKDEKYELMLDFAAGASVRLEVEAVGVRVEDVTRPHKALSDRAPEHNG